MSPLESALHRKRKLINVQKAPGAVRSRSIVIDSSILVAALVSERVRHTGFRSRWPLRAGSGLSKCLRSKSEIQILSSPKSQWSDLAYSAALWPMVYAQPNLFSPIDARLSASSARRRAHPGTEALRAGLADSAPAVGPNALPKCLRGGRKLGR
jgi:hypothetical protein